MQNKLRDISIGFQHLNRTCQR